jgi:hypothetical protein
MIYWIIINIRIHVHLVGVPDRINLEEPFA